MLSTSTNETGMSDGAPMNAKLILALAEIDRLKTELKQTNEKLVIYELDSQIAEGAGGTDQSNDWQSEIDGWINVDQDEHWHPPSSHPGNQPDSFPGN